MKRVKNMIIDFIRRVFGNKEIKIKQVGVKPISLFKRIIMALIHFFKTAPIRDCIAGVNIISFLLVMIILILFMATEWIALVPLLILFKNIALISFTLYCLFWIYEIVTEY